MFPDQPSTVAVRFMLDADPSPGLLPRLLEPLAKRDLVPDRMWTHRNRDVMHVEIELQAMPAEMMHLVEGNMRQVVGVHSLLRLEAAALRQAA